MVCTGSQELDAAALQALGYRIALGTAAGYAGLIDLNRINQVVGAPELLKVSDQYGG